MQNILKRNILLGSRKLVHNKVLSYSALISKNINTKLHFRNSRQKENKGQEKTESKAEEKAEENNKTSENTENTENQEEEHRAEYKTSRKIRVFIFKMMKWACIFGGLLVFYNAYLYKSKENPEEHTGYIQQLNDFVKNAHYFWFLTYGSLTLPYHEKILPDALEVVGQPAKKTLVVNLNKTLINYEYKFGSGFEILKRPGLLRFLQEMGQIYELVIFGTEDSNFVEEVCSKLDHFDMNIRYKLGKEATRLVNGTYVKDLEFLNRDLKNVLCIDFDADNLAFNPQNAIILPEFRGDGTDRELMKIVVFLREMAKPEVKDVRKELEKYGNYRPYIKFYKSDPKYKKLLPREEYENVRDDSDLQAVRNKK